MLPSDSPLFRASDESVPSRGFLGMSVLDVIGLVLVLCLPTDDRDWVGHVGMKLQLLGWRMSLKRMLGGGAYRLALGCSY